MPRRGMTEMKKPKDAKGTFKRLLKYLSDFRLVLIVALVLSFLGNVCGLISPSLAGKAINEAAAGAGNVNMATVKYYALRMLIMYLISSFTTIFINILMTITSKNIGRKMRRDIFDKMMKLPVKYFDVNQAGDIISRVSYDIDVVCTSLSTDVVHIMTSAVTVVGSLIMMLTISPLLALIVVVVLPISIIFTVKMRKLTQPRFRRRSKSYGAMNGFVEEMLSGQKTIQAYAFGDDVCEGFDVVNTEAAEAYHKADGLGCVIGPTMTMMNNTCLTLIAVFGSISYMTGMVTLGQISSFVLYSRKFTGPVNEIANIINELFSALSAAERVFNMLDADEEPADPEQAYALTDVNGNVELVNVNFGYDKNKTILHNLSLKADAGKLIAIVGPTGAGKTTIINLLMRFYDIDSGSIIVDDDNIMNYTRSSLRNAYAMVLQDTWVFNGTIFENIAYGKEGATLEEVVKAAKAAHIHSFIMQLPEGYQTVISEDGGNISKGQKQMLTIARAMLYDAKMLILDEATSNVDTSTERQIQAAMRELMNDKTCFVIAHRLSTIQHADRILVVNSGDVVEQGTHSELMQLKGFYYNLYSAQFN